MITTMETCRASLRVVLTLGFVAALALSEAVTPATLAGQAGVLTVDDLHLEVGVSSAAISPDGRSVVVVTRRPNYADNRFDRTLVLVDIAARTQRLLTPGRTNVSQPQWSRSGSHLAFLDVPRAGTPAELFVLPAAGGEAWQVTHTKNGVNAISWSSDGRDLLYTTSEAAVERQGEERHSWVEWIADRFKHVTGS